ncbi:MAG: putative glycolipid-binding domain-containing protein, partial [Chloroflexota bacterium]|nr:putative glycolipid-binding domain-containing protein [Chloroflexota bacterium]
MHREIIWRSDDGIGAEYVLLSETERGIVADSVVFATREVEPTRTRYRAEVDADWRIRSISVTVERAGEAARSLDLHFDGKGHWRDGAGQSLPEFDGCFDIDISATPFTNTLPIRRLRLQPGQIEPISVLFIHVPTLEIEVWEQRYTGLTPEIVRYESVGTDFRRELTIDADGLVIE